MNPVFRADAHDPFHVGAFFAREFFGQVIRLTGAATKTFIGLVPTGNTGGANVSAIRPMPIDPELARIIERARDPG